MTENRAKKWKNLKEFVEAANKKCNWLVLRNFENLMDDNFFSFEDDIDILCENLDNFTKTLGLIKRSWGISSYQAIIENKIIDIDVRFLGDGYYDKLWQYKMLIKKAYTKNKIPILSDEDYYYSLIYHIKLQKSNVNKNYKKTLNEIAIRLQNVDLADINDDSKSVRILADFMNLNSYSYTEPNDISVFRNALFIKSLKKKLNKPLFLKMPISVKLVEITPRFLKDLIPLNLKQKIKNGIKSL